MKKLTWALSLAVLFTFTCQLMAQAEEYGMYTGGKNAGWRVPSGQGHLGAFTALKENALVFNIEKNETDGFSYGTFLYDRSSNKMVAGSEEFVGKVGAGETGAGGFSEIFGNRETVGVWVQVDGQKYYSVNSVNLDPAGQKQQFTGTYLNNPEDGYAYVWYTQSNTPSQSEPPNSVIRLALTGGLPSSSGVPLPGVLATMLLCGGVGGVGGYLRKRGAGDGSARE